MLSMFGRHILSAAVLLLSLVAVSPTGALSPEMNADEAIIAEAEAADIAAMKAQDSGDLETFASYISDDYVYIDLSGNRVDKQMILTRRTEDKHAWIEQSASEEEAIVLAPTVVLLRGRTDGVSSYYGGLPRPASGRYSVIWRKEQDGRWRMVASQSTDRIKREYPVKSQINLNSDALAQFAGDYVLATKTPLTIRVRVGRASLGGGSASNALLASIPGEFDDMEFYPDGAASFFATKRPFELRFAPSGDALTLTTWGLETAGERVDRAHATP